MESELQEIARETGSAPEALVKDLIARRLAVRQIDEILAPFRQEVAANGMIEDELDAFFQEAREEVWQEKNGNAL